MTLCALNLNLHVHLPTNDCGLGGLLALVQGRESPMPLVGVRVRTRITGILAHTTVEQRFRNTLSAPMEAVHMFPVPSEGAIVACELHCGDLVVRASCKEREEAEATFQKARTSGHRAALLTSERADIHTLRVTNLPPGEEVRVRIEIVERLHCEDGRVLWRFPTVIAPRYLPGNAVSRDDSGPGVRHDTDLVPDASRISPPLSLAGGAQLDLEVALDGQPGRVESSLHALSVGFENGIRIAPSGDARCDRDFILAVTWADPQSRAASCTTWAGTDGAYTLVHVEPPAIGAKVMPRDAMFVVDISGSMQGSKMTAAKRALTAALHGLCTGDRFALLAFDDRLEHFTPDFVAYDAASLDKADRWIGKLQPRGGTEMLPAIQHALRGQTPEGRLRTVLFITDGQAENEQELVAAVANRRGEARFFTLGIDTAVNEALLKRLARVGGGTGTFATPSDDIEAVVARLEARMGSPVALDVRVSGEGVEAANSAAVAVFSGVAVGLLVKGAPAQLALSMRTAAGNELVMLENRPMKGASPLAALWGRERVAMLEDRLVLKPFEEEALRPEIVRVALAANIASRFTAFVAVEESRVVPGQTITVVQPHALPAAWEDTGSHAPMSSAPRGGGYGSLPPGAVMGGSIPVPSASIMPAAPAARSVTLGLDDDAGDDAPAMSAPSMKRSSVVRSRGVFQRVMDAFTGSAPPEAEVAAPEEDTAFFAGPPAGAAPADRSAPMPPPPSSPARPAPQRLGPPSSRSEGAPQQRPDAFLAGTQGADGSFGGDVLRTAAALLALILLGNTRSAGLRKRNVQKAAAWLATQSHPEAVAALAALEAAERGVMPVGPWPALVAAGVEGRELAGLG